MQDPETKPYVTERQGDRFVVRNPAGRTVMACRDEGSAAEYAVLLNEAYQLGYRAGYRCARASPATGSRPAGTGSHLRASDSCIT